MPRVSRSMMILWMLALPVGAVGAAPVDARPGQEYHLAPNNGPWMIRVATFRGSDALRWANALVYEIRKDQHIPAYIYTAAERRHDFARFMGRTTADDQILGRDGRMHHIKYANAEEDEVTVLAGEVGSREDAAARNLLDFFRTRFHSRSVPAEAFSYERQISVDDQELQGLGIVANTNPVVMVINPKTPPQRFVSQPSAKLLQRLRRMNACPYSLYTCPPRTLTLQVATFGGTSSTNETVWNKWMQQRKSLLAEAPLKAADLTARLRQAGVEAYVFHGQYASIVTIGCFTTKGDPRLEQARAQFAGRVYGPHTLLAHPIAISVPRRP